MKKTVLDDMNEILKIDRSNMLAHCANCSKHYEQAATLAKETLLDYPRPEAVIVAGMGGSAIGGELFKDWSRDKLAVPVEICREYSLPAYAGKGTLVFVVSYSGETEESLSVFLDAVKRKCSVVAIGSGGLLLEFAEKLGLPYVRVPSGMAPRAALPYLFIPLPVLMEKTGLVKGVSSEVSEAIKILRQVSDLNRPEIPLEENFSKTLATDICETIPVIYGFGLYRAAAQRFKTQLNENSKIPAKWEFFPELDHNEIVGWENAEKLARFFSVILIRDKFEPKALRQRIEVTSELIAAKSVRTFKVQVSGKGSLAKMSSAICVGDFVSVYLALLRGIDPTPVKTITALKERLGQTGLKAKIRRELERLVR
ncbi:bifunctional phosphoglucose/phosphomannose isomerase [Candidatus Bathyarchaeota archaeon]|nr:bifunctional phosphoglucose/phosphomannose isomerase [Candidatus Bathyarchaeota archaeon]